MLFQVDAGFGMFALHSTHHNTFMRLRDANHGNYADSFEQKVRLGLERGQRLHLLLQCAGTVTVA